MTSLNHDFDEGDRVVVTCYHLPILGLVTRAFRDDDGDPINRVVLRYANEQDPPPGQRRRHDWVEILEWDCWDAEQFPHPFTPDLEAHRPDRCFGCRQPADGALHQYTQTSDEARAWAAAQA